MNDLHFNASGSTVTQLQERIRLLERGTTRQEMTVRPTGCPGLDALFPLRGIRQGSLVEWIDQGPSSGAGSLSLLTSFQVMPQQQSAVLIDTQHQTYPPALAAWGVDLSRLVMVRPATEHDALWACEETLRCQAAAIVWAQIDHLSTTAARRLRLAVEQSSGICFLVRPAKALRQPSWAEVRLQVSPLPGFDESPTYRVSVAYCQGRSLRSSVDIKIDKHRGTIDELAQPSVEDSLLLVS
ncbi:hypothetical protein AB1K70_18245 [Bremerella sp. JC770]|uniref:ImuA family protein n=1 Tax=Bremerella sp. JC770 TaxID=3232137 RepID=UPI003457609D